MQSDTFRGPLFLVGMPRSGTKLLRGMLSQHPRVRFSDIETDFFPYWVSQWHRFGAVGTPDAFARFYRSCMQQRFFVENARRGIRIDRDEWFRSCEDFSAAGVFEGLMRCCLSIPRDDRSIVWGDKSPSYVRHVSLLNREFAGARIVHIIRDVRDYSLSVEKAWGKSVLRAAQRWQDDVSKARGEGRRLPSAYMEIQYEELVAEPRATLEAVCDFCGIEFTEQLLNVSRATESLGDAKGMSTVLRSNVRKYQSRMPAALVYKIEKIACVSLRELGYPCSYQGEPVRLSGWKLRVLQALDGFNVIRSSTSEYGLVNALRSQIAQFRTSGNRVR